MHRIVPRQPDFSLDERVAVFHHLIAKLSKQQLDQLDRGEAVRFQRGCNGDAPVDNAHSNFKQAMRSNARARTVTRKQSMKAACRSLHRYNRSRPDGLRSIRKKRSHLATAECHEAEDALCTPVEHNDGMC